MYWWWISINRWKVLWQAPLRLLKRQISSDYINACFNSSRVCFTAAVFSHEGAYARFPGFDGGVHGGWPFSGMPLDKIAATMEKGMGGTLGFLAVVVALGAMFGKILHETGAVDQIAVENA